MSVIVKGGGKMLLVRLNVVGDDPVTFKFQSSIFDVVTGGMVIVVVSMV